MSLPHIGIGSFTNHMSRPNRWLRRYALFFDRIEITDLDHCLYVHRTDIHGKAETVRECDWLIENGYLSQLKYEDLAWESASPSLTEIERELEALVREHQALDDEYMSHFDPLGGFQEVPAFLLPNLQRAIQIGHKIMALQAARAAVILRLRGQAIATNLEMPQTSVDAELRPASLLRFVIDGLPVPSKRVPWSEILAFKSDPDSDERLRALRAWVTTTARGGFTLAEASDQLSFALSSYREHVRSAGIAHDMATWEALLRSGIVSPNESIDKWMQGQSARPFDLAVAAAGAHAERYAPGREVSYLVKIEDADL